MKKRIDEIKELLLQNNKVMVSELSERYQVSEVSIRKDLTILEKEGYAKKFYGGATLILQPASPDAVEKDFYQNPTLAALAERASLEINDGDTIFLGSGRTCCILARLLQRFKNLTVVTNNITALRDLLGNVSRVYLIGGEVTSTDGLTLFSSWEQPQAFTDNVFVNKAFTSISGLDLKAGLTVNSIISTYVYKHIPTMAHKWYLLVDATKFDRIAIYPVADINRIQAIISDSIPENYREYFQDKNIQAINITA